MYPNTLFVSWLNWVPSYVRSEFKKKTGVAIDEKGNIVSKKSEGKDDEDDLNNGMFNNREPAPPGQKDQKQFKSINQYKPTGNLIYNKEMFEKLEKKIQFQEP